MSTVIFSWTGKQRSSWTLAGCIFAMLFMHSLAFFVFQAALPERTTAPRTAPPVQILTPFAPDGTRSAENEALLRWIASKDPAIIARVPVVEPPDLLAVPYRPSYLALRTAPLAAPPEPTTIQFPSARDPMSVIFGSARSNVAVVEAVLEPNPTAVDFSESLKKRAAAEIKITPPQILTKPVVATRFRIGVNADGAVSFYFLQEPCGEPALDAAAQDFLSALKFAPAAGVPVEWGTATFRWGDDALAKTQ